MFSKHSKVYSKIFYRKQKKAKGVKEVIETSVSWTDSSEGYTEFFDKWLRYKIGFILIFLKFIIQLNYIFTCANYIADTWNVIIWETLISKT